MNSELYRKEIQHIYDSVEKNSLIVYINYVTTHPIVNINRDATFKMKDCYQDIKIRILAMELFSLYLITM